MFAQPPATPPAPVVQGIVVERVPRDAPDQGLRAGELIVSFKLDHKPAVYQEHADALVTVSGLGSPRWAKKAPFSAKSGRCLDAHPAHVLRSWKKGRKVSVTVRTGDGHGHYRLKKQRVRVVPFNLGESEQAYATTVLDCFFIVK